MLEYWYMFPVAVLFSSIAMATGIGGASMFTPFFFLVMNLPAAVAVGAGLFIEVFGFTSGLIGFAKKRLIEYKVGFFLLCFTLPAAIAGAITSGFMPDWVIMAMLTVLLWFLGYFIIRPSYTVTDKSKMRKSCPHDASMQCYEEPESKKSIVFLSILGGLFAGMISTGVGEINDYNLLKKYKMHGPPAAGTSVFVVAITVIVGTIAHAYNFFTQHIVHLPIVVAIVVFAVPGVLLGAQLGVRVAQKMNDGKRDYVIGTLFLTLAVVTFLSLIL